MLRRLCLVITCLVITCLVSTAILLAQQPTPLTNSDIAKMLKAGLRPEIIKTVIDVSPGTYDTSPAALRQLKTAGASQQLLDAIAAKTAAAARPATTPTTKARARISASKHPHGASAGSKLRNPSTAGKFSTQIQSLQAETCEADISTADDCHGNHKTGCSNSSNPRYDAYLNYLKNGLPDPASTASAAVNGGNPVGADFFTTLEGQIPDTLTSTNHAQHGEELAQMGEGQIVTVIGTLYYAMASGKETCNCELSGDDSVVDFHIGVGFNPFPLGADVLNQLRNGGAIQHLGHSDQQALQQPSIVVEMTPYYREQFRPGWTLAKVQAATGRQIRATGQLMIDNAHTKAADDCGLADADTSKCWRASVWEVHPLTSFQVCSADQCDANSTNWVNLEDMQ